VDFFRIGQKLFAIGVVHLWFIVDMFFCAGQNFLCFFFISAFCSAVFNSSLNDVD
jgi:hypothetical protein